MSDVTETAASAAEVGRSYFAAIGARDIEGALAHWAPDGVEIVSGERLPLPDGFRAYFSEAFAAFPDFTFEVLDLISQDDRCVVRYRVSGTFAGPGSFQGFEPTGARISVEGCDVLQVRDGLIRRNDAYVDGSQIAAQLGLLPPPGSPAQARLARLLNLRTRLGRHLAAGEPERIANGVWIVRGGFPARAMNVYLIEHGTGVVLFDAGIRSMTNALAAAGAALGGIQQVVLGHAHADHRGAAAGLGAPVYCHAAEVADAEADGGEHYFDYGRLALHGRLLMPRLIRHWDGGPVRVAGTLAEGDEVAGFRVIHLPGHAPGMIGLFREQDRLALTSDCFYTLDPQTGRKGAPRVPHVAFNHDDAQARASIRKLAALEPAAAWPGHADPLTGDVRAQLERAAAST